EWIPRILTTGTAPDGRSFMVMERVQHPSLRQVIDERGKLPVIEVIVYALRVAETLAYAHAAGVVHRDINPENILVGGPGERARVVDFGIAKRVREIDAAVRGAAGGTKSTPLGTPAYLSPEAALGRPVDHRADFYALGVVMHEAISGEKPFAV